VPERNVWNHRLKMRVDIKTIANECYLKILGSDFFGQIIDGINYFTDVDIVFDSEFAASLVKKENFLCFNAVNLLYTEKRLRFLTNIDYRITFGSKDLLPDALLDRASLLLPQNSSIIIRMGFCQEGQYLDSQTMKCKDCEVNFFSKEINVSRPSTCINCERYNFYCYGGSNLSPKRGFWRVDQHSTNFIKCPVSEGKANIKISHILKEF
jgi:hypothetical protein